MWVSRSECKKVPCIVDERICGDTFLRVEQIGELDVVVGDIWMYNSNCVFACSTFRQRYDWLKNLLSRFTTYIEGVTIDLIHKDDLGDVPIKGYEEHSEEMIGKLGYFMEKDDSQKMTIVKLAIPDCYEIPGKGFLRVPDIKTSVFLRSKGDRFECRCVLYEEQYWDIIENIPELEVNAETHS